MRITKGLILSLILILILVGCGKDNGNMIKDKEHNIIEEDKVNNLPNENKIEIDPIEEKIRSMSLDEKIGQLLIVGFEGEKINDDILSYIHDLKVGGFILFSRNIREEGQVVDLLNDLKYENSKNNIPLFLSIDEEGGKVSRLPSTFTRLPEAIKVGEKNHMDISYKFGQLIGERIKILGFNLNFAPILDINSNPKNTVIGNRAFGTTVSQVTDNALEAMIGMRDIGIIPSVKHFPGHGDTDVDSHINLPEVNKTLDEITSFELVPFIKAIDDDVEMIMISHILYPKIDIGLPATMSNKIIQELLRDRLKFKGVIVSDDMTMGAIVKNYTLEEGVLSFLKSGGDIALICHGIENPKKIFDAIKEEVNSGLLTEKEIDTKLYRILKLKDRYNLEDKIIEKTTVDEINEKTKLFLDELKK